MVDERVRATYRAAAETVLAFARRESLVRLPYPGATAAPADRATLSGAATAPADHRVRLDSECLKGKGSAV